MRGRIWRVDTFRFCSEYGTRKFEISKELLSVTEVQNRVQEERLAECDVRCYRVKKTCEPVVIAM